MRGRHSNGACIERIIMFHIEYVIVNSVNKRTMPICFTPSQLKLVERYAKKRCMLNLSQAIEDIIKNT